MALRIPEAEPCPFCEYLSGREPCAFVRRTERTATFVNLRQYQRGALLVVPVAHAPSILDLDGETLAAVQLEAQAMAAALIAAFDATGVNVFQNNGVDAGQTVPHYHVHVVPRYAGGDPHRLFAEGSFAPVPLEERNAIAAQVRAVLGRAGARVA